LNSGPTPRATPPAFFFVMGFFWDRVSQTICLGLASNRNPPDPCLLSSWDYRRDHGAWLIFVLSTIIFHFSSDLQKNPILL
jgi:hypothetical protein